MPRRLFLPLLWLSDEGDPDDGCEGDGTRHQIERKRIIVLVDGASHHVADGAHNRAPSGHGEIKALGSPDDAGEGADAPPVFPRGKVHEQSLARHATHSTEDCESYVVEEGGHESSAVDEAEDDDGS